MWSAHGSVESIERRLERFLREPPSVRNAAGVIVTATAAVVVGAGVLISLIDGEEYPNVWIGMWYALPTVTTVGYGDVTQTELGGRLVGVLLMLHGTAFIAIVTAVITSTFVARATREAEARRASGELSEREAMDRRFERRLDSSLFGRREELAQMQAAFDRAVSERRCPLVTVSDRRVSASPDWRANSWRWGRTGRSPSRAGASLRRGHQVEEGLPRATRLRA